MVRITKIALLTLVVVFASIGASAQSVTFDLTGTYKNKKNDGLSDVGTKVITGWVEFQDTGSGREGEALDFSIDFGGLYTFTAANTDANSYFSYRGDIENPNVSDLWDAVLTRTDGTARLTLIKVKKKKKVKVVNSNLAELTTGTGAKVKSAELTLQTAVPEPATWLMMLAGFAVTGVALRRRSKVALAA